MDAGIIQLTEKQQETLKLLNPDSCLFQDIQNENKHGVKFLLFIVNKKFLCW